MKGSLISAGGLQVWLLHLRNYLCLLACIGSEASSCFYHECFLLYVRLDGYCRLENSRGIVVGIFDDLVWFVIRLYSAFLISWCKLRMVAFRLIFSFFFSLMCVETLMAFLISFCFSEFLAISLFLVFFLLYAPYPNILGLTLLKTVDIRPIIILYTLFTLVLLINNSLKLTIIIMIIIISLGLLDSCQRLYTASGRGAGGGEDWG